MSIAGRVVPPLFEVEFQKRNYFCYSLYMKQKNFTVTISQVTD